MIQSGSLTNASSHDDLDLSPPLTPKMPLAEKAYLASIAGLVGQYVGEKPEFSSLSGDSSARNASELQSHWEQAEHATEPVVIRRYLPPVYVRASAPIGAVPIQTTAPQVRPYHQNLADNKLRDMQYRMLHPWDLEWWQANAQAPIMPPPMHDLQMALRSWDASNGVLPLAVEPPMPLLCSESPNGPPPMMELGMNSVWGTGYLSRSQESYAATASLASKPSATPSGTNCVELTWHTVLPVDIKDLVIDCIIESENFPSSELEPPTQCSFQDMDRPHLLNGSQTSWQATVRQLRPNGAEYRFRVVPVVSAGKAGKPSAWSDVFRTPTAPRAPTVPLVSKAKQPDWLLADEGVVELQWSVATALGGSAEVDKCEVQQKLAENDPRGHASIDRSAHGPFPCDFVTAPRVEERHVHSSLGMPEIIWTCKVRVSRHQRAGSLGGRAYWCFRVRAGNGVGFGPWGGWSSPASPADVHGRNTVAQRVGQFMRTGGITS
eukprot:gnl/MRDRNA2_/MRDRNA2_65607_c0_seq1.p1 gnl/MRDRNA2_/MRDRNA2_65607_c0~~gnl/MRDRNA2_/MRDRNA2_65607_c0_seq1.p1  ORF type:complete len:492 (+),score=61.23 gnl/MRDRNA2_/MRDRNA2_65607_c0_seq1:67-1542(+)